MAEVSRTVREGLSRQAAGEHPDANLLSAFAERSLTDGERAQVLDHLSRCTECRQVVALVLPAGEEEAAHVADRPEAGGRSWWRLPVVHWAALTAAALVVLIAVGERIRPREGQSASVPAITRPSMKEVEQKPAIPMPELPFVSTQPKQSSRKVANLPEPPPKAPAVTAGKPDDIVSKIIAGSAGGSGTGSGGGIGSGAGMRSAPTAAPAPAAPKSKTEADRAAELNAAPGLAAKKVAPAAPLPLLKPNENFTSTDQTVQRNGQFDQTQAQAAVPPPSIETREKVESGSVVGGPLKAPASESQAIIGSQRPPPVNFAKRALVSPRWSVSDSGAVQRSLDGGRTWKDVAVANGTLFRAVAALVNDIWAGGSGGALFHSTDGGEHWVRVPVELNGRSLSGDIVRVDFTGAASVVVTSSNGEVWTTSDAGAHWRPQ